MTQRPPKINPEDIFHLMPVEDSSNKINLCYNRQTLESVALNEEDRFLNMLVVGPTGTGKSSQVFLPMIYQDVVNSECGVTVFDPKEDLAERAYEIAKQYSDRKVIYVDPLDSLCPRFNLFIGSRDQVIKSISKIFTSGIVGSATEKSNIDMQRMLIEKSITILKEFPGLVGDNINVKTYSQFISNKGNEPRMMLVEIKDRLMRERGSPEMIEICTWFIKQYFETNTRLNEACYDFRMKIEEIASNEYLSSILSPTTTDQNILNFDEALAFGYVVIVNTRYSLLGHMAKTFGEFLLMSYMNSVFRRKKYQADHRLPPMLRPNFLYIDEFATFAPVTVDLFTQGRSFRVGTHIAVQNRALLQICGEQDSTAQATVIEANMRNLVLFPGMEGSDAKYYSSQFFNITPQEILYRPFGQIVYRIVQNKTIIPPNVGLVFFVDEVPHARSIAKEFKFDSEGNLLPSEYVDDSPI